MDEIKHLTDPENTLQIINALQKISKSIERQKSKTDFKESAVKEIDFLKEQCQSANVQLSLLSCQLFVHLVENGVLQPANILTMFISMLPNAR